MWPITVLETIGGLDLIASLILGLIYFLAARNATDSFLGIVVGIAIVLQGLFVWSLFSVIALIAKNLIAIRRNSQVRIL